VIRREEPRRVVAIGGGHGQAASLRAIKRYASEITAIVSVADDGGSSGRLRELLGIPAPGDIRVCLGALLPEGSAVARAMEHRFGDGELDGHALGNLVIAAFTASTGDFVAGVAETCRMLGIEGSVVPATTVPVVLKAETSGTALEGQVAISQAGHIGQVSLVPPDAEPPPSALAAIAAADQIVIGPGSLYTSVLAACSVPALRDALAEAGARGAQRVYVSNLREQRPETAGYDVADHLRALASHGVGCDVVLADTSGIRLGSMAAGTAVLETPLAGPNGLVHSVDALSPALEGLLAEWRHSRQSRSAGA
jgi:uncharacterized cofD-like protein